MRSGHLLEVNGVSEIFARPKHPYTRLLMESLPSFERDDSFLGPTSAVPEDTVSTRSAL
jgi:peptide/nickel transport system ATP-binding protein